jgi:hypothetical protein
MASRQFFFAGRVSVMSMLSSRERFEAFVCVDDGADIVLIVSLFEEYSFASERTAGSDVGPQSTNSSPDMVS